MRIENNARTWKIVGLNFLPIIFLSNMTNLRAKGFFHLTLVYLIWGSTFLGIRFAVRGEGGFPPYTLAAIRVGIAALIMFLVSILSGKSLSVSRATLLHLVITGLLLWVGGHAWVIWGAQKADSGYAALLFGATPLWAVLFEFLIHKKSLNLPSFVSILLEFTGIICLSVPGLLDKNNSGNAPDLLTFLALSLAPASWALGSVLQGDKLKEIPALVSAGYQQLFAAIGCGLLALFFSEPIPHPSNEALFGLSYITLLGSVVAFYSFTRALQILPSSIVMSFAYVNPVIAVILGFFWAGEQITFWSLAGMFFIITGVIILLQADKNHLADKELEHGNI